MKPNPHIAKIKAVEVLDSRGNPTIKVKVQTIGGVTGTAYVPSGASTGSHEALELRDSDKNRFSGKGVLKAISNVEKRIYKFLQGVSALDQQKIDRLMLEHDNTPNKSNLGANAMLGVSLACARAGAFTHKIPLFRHIQEVYSLRRGKRFPIPMSNLINGGRHSDSGLDIQEFLVVPAGITRSFAEKMRAVSETYAALGKILKEKGYSVAVGDEGGYAARLPSNQAALEFLERATENAGYRFGEEIMLGIDAAASEFYNKDKGTYLLVKEHKELSSHGLVSLYKKWSERFPLAIIEDGLAEDDWKGWKHMNNVIGGNVTLIGDDFTVTNTVRLQRAIEENACNAVLIKPNQIGTLSETIECIRVAQAHKFKVAVSHRSGETCDHFIADLAIATHADFLKSGAPCRGERAVKYNRVIEIEKWM